MNNPMFWVLVGMVAFAAAVLKLALKMERASEKESRERRAHQGEAADQAV